MIVSTSQYIHISLSQKKKKTCNNYQTANQSGPGSIQRLTYTETYPVNFIKIIQPKRVLLMQHNPIALPREHWHLLLRQPTLESH